MSAGTVDEGQRMPRSVLVAADELYLKISDSPRDVGLLDDLHAMVVPYSIQPSFHSDEIIKVRQHLLRTGKLVPGSLLIQNPYDRESYEFAESAIEAFASAKYHAMANVARLLGATEVQFKEARVETRQKEWAFGVKGGIKAVDADGDASSQVKDQIKAQLHGQLTFPGSRPRVLEALEYMKRRNLSDDRQLRDLVDMRDDRGVGDEDQNLVTSQVVRISGTREAEASFRSALSIANAGPIKALQISTTFTKSATSIRNIEIVTEITF
ncbi:hypothetical protein [Microcella alkaliphila]|uniref:Uncharacterized protein n=1 Tax=Microcella alkaliphila TaxID=279828 RepID=A0A0U5BMJ2_9MICO|nr:hypothetical protein [Microcella alkaliphila]BAU32059.1 uncharacterized protein MalAC0309_1202 [Microcella alkaliphila]